MIRLRQLYKENQFHPGPAALFLNPFFLIRYSLRKTLLPFIPRLKGNLLDYGCGSKPYQSLFSVSQYTGADIENPGHSHEQEDIEILFDGKNLPVPDQTFDSAFSSEVFEHVFNPDETLKEIYRVLKPGALFLVSVPFVWNEHEVPYDYARYSSFGFPHLLKKNGFEIVEIRKSGHFVPVIAQLWALYLYQRLEKLPMALKVPFWMILITPVTLLGWVGGWIFPKDESLYFNLVLLARKPQ